MQTTSTTIHPLYVIFVLGTFFGLDLGTIESFLVGNLLSTSTSSPLFFWCSALLWIGAFLALGAYTTSLTSMVIRGVVATGWSSLIAGFLTFVTSNVVMIRHFDFHAHSGLEHSFDQLGNMVGFTGYFVLFFCLWLLIMLLGLALGALGAGLARARQKAATV